MTAQAQLVVPGVWMLPFEIGQAYIWDWDDGLTVVDTGVASSASAILHAVQVLGREPSDVKEIVLTHYHDDHRGGASAARREDRRPGARPPPGGPVHQRQPAADSGESRRLRAPDRRGRAGSHGTTARRRGPVQPGRARAGPDADNAATGTVPVPVTRTVEDGDQTAGGGQIVHIPGHTPGSIALLAPSIGVLFTGDTAASHEGSMIPGVFNIDRAELLRSIGKLARPDVGVACFGHGAPVTHDAGRQIQALTQAQ